MTDTPRISVELLARADLSLKSTLPESWGRTWQEVLNDTGNGRLTLQNDDPDLALVEYGDYVRFSLDGAAVFAIVVEAMDRTDIAQGEEVDEVTVISGRGAVAILESVVIEPDSILGTVPFGDARVFNFSSLLLATCPDSWVTPYDWGDRASAGPYYTNKPADYPPIISRWVGPQAPDGSGNNPVGDWYFWAVVVGLPTTRYRLFFGFDDGIEWWIDNVPLFSNAQSTIDTTSSIDLYLDSPVHVFACKVTNTVFGGGPTGFTATLCTLNPDDSVDTVYWYAGNLADPLQFVMPYPAQTPGNTPGGVVEALYLEATGPPGRSVDALELVTLGFDDAVDSNGDAWTECITPSVNIGTDMLTFLKQLAESSFDWWFDPATWTLNLYPTRGTTPGVSYTEAVSITELQHSGAF